MKVGEFLEKSRVARDFLIRIRLIERELPKDRNTPEGLHNIKYYVQYVSLDGFILKEREADSYDLNDFFRYVKKVGEINGR